MSYERAKLAREFDQVIAEKEAEIEAIKHEIEVKEATIAGMRLAKSMLVEQPKRAANAPRTP
jgi:hypothetical protein